MARLIASAASGARAPAARIAGVPGRLPSRVAAGVVRGEPSRDPATLEAAAEVLRLAVGDSPDAQHRRAIAYLLTGNARMAGQTLSRAIRQRPSATMWNDLAAALYEQSLDGTSSRGFVESLVAADAALDLDPSLAEARFNRALSIDELGIREAAVEAWKGYLEIDAASEWAVKARERLAALEPAPGEFRDQLDRAYERIASDSRFAAAFGEKFAQEVRTWGESEILGRWAEAVRQRDEPAARRHLSVAGAFGRSAAGRGDLLLEQAVKAIEAASPAQRSSLAEGHSDLRAGQRLFKELKPAAAEPLLRRAVESLERGGSPAVYLARTYRASMAYEQGRVDEATAELLRLRSALPAGFRSAGAQLEWQLSLCHGARGRYGEAIESAGRAIRTFDEIGEHNHASTRRLTLAWLHELVGEEDPAAALRLAALRDVGRTNTRMLHAALGSVAQTAIVRRDWRTARSLLDLQLGAVRRASSHPFVADALLRRALVLRRMERHEAAGADLEEARRTLAEVTDPGVRGQLEGRLFWVEGALAVRPDQRVARLTRAVDVHRAANRRTALPSMLLDRARAHREAGDPDAAMADVDAAIAELEANRDSLPRGDARWGIFHAAEDLFHEAIDLSLLARDAEAAFGYSEKARARTLLDRLRPSGPFAFEDLPDGAAVVEYAATESRLVIFLAGREGVRTASVAVRRDALRAGVEQLDRAIEEGNELAMREAGAALYALALQPVASWLAPNQTLVVVPDRTLSSVPFAALRSPRGRYLAEEHPIVVAPSAAVFAALSARSRQRSTSPLLAVGDDDAPGRERLPNAAREAREVARMYGRSLVLEGNAASAEAFRREARHAGTIHFSGHALSSDLRAEDTFLVLRSDTGGEERLDANEVAGLQLDNARMVVLAACSTARGRTTAMEGTMSVARAFLAAGSPAVVATLRPIDDREAAAFFTRLHERLARGISAAEALRATQVESIGRAESPAVWAAVQLIGS